MQIGGIEGRGQAMPAPNRLETQPGQGHETRNDQEKLDHLVIDRPPQAPGINVGHHHQGGRQYGRMEDPGLRQVHGCKGRIQHV